MINLIKKRKDILLINNIGNWLLSLKIGQDDIVLIEASYSEEIEQIILACTLLGITYSLINNKSKHKEYIYTLLEPKLIIRKKEDIFYSEDNTSLKLIYKSKRLAILFSSGTTGLPKGIELSRNGVFNSARNFDNFFKIKGKTLVLGELNTMSGLRNKIYVPLLGNMILEKKDRFRNLQHLNNYIKEKDIKNITCVPYLIKEIFKNKEIESYGLLENIVSSGDIISKEEIKYIFHRYNIKIFNNYGLTETSGFILGTNEENFMDEGLLIPIFSKIKIENNILKTKTNLMIGYFKNKELTKEKIIKGWFSTDDIVKEENNMIVLIERKKDLIKNKRGEFVSSIELEKTIKAKLKELQEIIITKEESRIIFYLKKENENLKEEINKILEFENQADEIRCVL